MNLRYLVTLAVEEKSELEALAKGGTERVRHVKRAQILLAAHIGITDEQIASSVRMSISTVYRVKRRFVEGGVEHALHERQRPGASRKLSGKQEALLVATVCSTPPKGRALWTLQLLADELVRLTEHEDLSRATVRRRLEENELKPWQQRMWCIPKVDAEYVARMKDVLELYAEPPDAKRPVVCFDETPNQLIGEVRTPLPAMPGKPRRYDFVPKHASWLNMVEIEISVLTRQCLDRRIGTKPALKREVARWERMRNKERARVRWRFSVDSARTKLGRAYPQAQAAVAAAA
ncbi:IS630 family transposase [Myxococcus sp. K38C18041901]|uniref:IS630 family transposase n=1 Tax=Myxococcus guangdongensis TaxID=2906760 RepID=UPI0020A795AA|nr:IS630 family transposase [Myxococcus guangdongensis]MCP3065754.1 IS630 family transposase [Myxococcus guangdongensis]